MYSLYRCDNFEFNHLLVVLYEANQLCDDRIMASLIEFVISFVQKNNPHHKDFSVARFLISCFNESSEQDLLSSIKPLCKFID